MAEQIVISLNTVAQGNGIRATVSGLAQVKTIADGVSAGIMRIGTRLIGLTAGVVGIHAVSNALRNAASAGIRFNQTVEDSSLGIAAILKQFDPQRFQNFTDAIKVSAAAVELLKRTALATPGVDFTQLAQSFRSITGIATAAGIGLRQQVELVVRLTQAVRGIGLRDDQIVQEARALLTGKIDRSSTLANILASVVGGPEQLRQQMAEAQRAGRLFEYLRDLLSSFAEAGKAAESTWSGALSKLAEAAQIKMGEVILPIFNAVKQGSLSLADALASTDVASALEGVSKRIADIVKKVFEIGQALTDNLFLLKSGRFDEVLSLLVQAGIEEGLTKAAQFTRSTLQKLWNLVFNVEFLIFSAQAGKHLAHALLMAVKLPVDLLVAGMEKAIQVIFNSFEKAADRFGDFLGDTILRVVNAYVGALNKIKIFGEFATLTRTDLFGTKSPLVQDLRSFSEIFVEAQKQSAEATKSYLTFFDVQIAATERLLKSGELTLNSQKEQISALEKLKQLRDELHADEMGRTEGGLSTSDFMPDPDLGGGGRSAKLPGFLEGLSNQVSKLTGQFETLGEAIGDTLGVALKRSIDAVADGLWAVIDGTMTWGEIFLQVGRSIISDLIRIGVQELLLDNLKRGIAATWKAFKSAMGWAEVADVSAQESAKTAAKTPTALLESITSYGAAALIGAAALAAVLAGVGAFEKGGVVRGGEQLIRVNESGREAILNAHATAMLGEGMINALNAGASPENAGMAGSGGGFGGGPVQFNVMFVDSRQSQAARDFFESSGGKVYVAELVRDQKIEIGIS